MCESFARCASSKGKKLSLWLVLLHMHNLMCIFMFEKEKEVCIGVMLDSLFGKNNYNCKIWFFMYVVGYPIPCAWKIYAYYVRMFTQCNIIM
jgi:hypothetical protein